MLTQDDRVVMKVNDLQCAFHMPKALLPKFRKKNGGALWLDGDDVDSRGEEIVQPLPPGAPRFVFPVDEYPACPANWMHGSAKASSYWLPVRPGCGMWLDFNYNYQHSHHVAVVVSIQGVNPITGQQTKQLRLEQYVENCPTHNVPFGQDRFCEQCGHQWDSQNYISTNATPRGLFWIDGFRGGDGVVRQYVFTEEMCKGVAAGIIGEDRVFAIGIAFYLSREPKPVAKVAPELSPYVVSSSVGGVNYSGGVVGAGRPPSFDHKKSKIKGVTQGSIVTSKRVSLTDGGAVNKNKRMYPPDDATSLHQYAGGSANLDAYYSQQVGVGGKEYNLETTTDFDVERSKLLDFAPNEPVSPSEIGHDLRQRTPEEIESEMKKLEITAGARIRQRIFRDPEQPDFWQDEPCGFVYLNYVDLQIAEKITAAGRQQRAGSFLDAMALS